MNVKMLAIATVAIIAVAAVGAYFIVFDGDPEDGPIQIMDSDGKTITLDAPIDKVVLVNTNAPKAMMILGLTDEVTGLIFSGTSTTTNYSTYSPSFPNVTSTMSDYNSVSAEELMTKAKYVICPVSSMTIPNGGTTQVAYEALGGTIIRLNLNGDDILDEFEKITTLFGKVDHAMTAYNSYMNTYNSVVNTVLAKAAAANTVGNNDTFLYYMNSSTAFYNETSAGSIMVEKIYGKNALRYINNTVVGDSVTFDATATGAIEAVVAEDGIRSIDKIFLRGSASNADTVAEAVTLWNNSKLYDLYGDVDIAYNSTNAVFVFDSDAMSGCLAYIGYVLIAEACGIDTGYDVSALISSFNTAYGLTEPTAGYMFKLTIVNGTATAATQMF